MTHAIEVKGLYKSFGSLEVLKGVSLTVDEGEVVSVIGPSGSGKSTLARCIARLENIDSGEISVYGRRMDKGRMSNAEESQLLGMIFQQFNLFPHLNVRDNILLAQTQVRGRSRAEAEEKARQLLDRVGLADKVDAFPAQLSGGQQQRVAIARALVCDGGLIVMDEPITNLDAKLREQMLMEIREIQRHLGTTILYITHDQQSALQLCDKMAVMQQDGSLCQVGTDEDIILRPANRFTFEFIGVSNFIPVVATDSGWGLDTGRGIVPWEGPLPETPDPSTGIELGVRPNDIVFDAASPLRAKVERRTFLGSEYDYHVTLGTRKLRVQQSTFDAARGGTANVGDEVGLRLLNPRFYQSKEEARP